MAPVTLTVVSVRRRLSFGLVVLILLVLGIGSQPVHAEREPEAKKPTSDSNGGDDGNAVASADDEALRSRAQKIIDLMEGDLDPAVDATRLFVLDLSDQRVVGATGQRLSRMLRQLEQPGPAKPKIPNLEGLEPARALEVASVAFLSLPPQRRQELLAAHAERRTAALAANRAEALARAEITATRQRADQLEAYLEGRLDVHVDPATLTTIDLADTAEVGLSGARRAAWTAGSADPPALSSESATDPIAQARAELEQQRDRLDTLRRRYVALSAKDKKRLLATHQQRVAEAREPSEPPPEPESESEPTEAEIETAQDISLAEAAADEAAEERERALDEARKAKTEARRIVAEEEARLLGIKEAQARYEAELNRRKAERGENHEKALEWTRRVDELLSEAKFASERAALADPLYYEIRSDLATLRARLRQQLHRIRSAGANVPNVGERLDRDLPEDVDRGEISDLRAQVLENEEVLEELEHRVDWELAQGLRDDVVLLNRTRLELLRMASPGLRSSVTGFGATGVDQVQRELDQISVELGFHVLKLFRYKDDFITRVRASAIPLLLGLVQVAIVLIVFSWWRRHARQLLTRSRIALRNRRPETWLASSGTTVIWYIQRIRRPLELLLLLWTLMLLVGDVDEVPELELLWIIAVWILAGSTTILFVDALAARETLFTATATDTSALRIHSLRVVGINVIAVGLILSLTSAMVGQGAIYSWVLSTCWLLSFPVALYLIYRWRPIIFERIDRRSDQGAVVKWIATNKTGAISFVTAGIGAVNLLGSGLVSWAIRQASGLETTRRVLAYLFRREVARKAAATETDAHYTPISTEIREIFDPERASDHWVGAVANDEVDQVAKLAMTPRSTLSAVVGERGAGKSAFLRRLAEKIDEDRVLLMTCPEQGFSALERGLAVVVGNPSLRGNALQEAIRQLGAVVIAIDDVQRLVIPAVNGLVGLDAFTAFARQVGGEVSWVVTIESASWHYLQRARGERLFFEQIVTIPRWSEEEIGALIRDRCKVAEIDPSFEGLVVPRQAEAPLVPHGDRTEHGYYRLLWDYSNGNPAVALHAFRESLFVSAEGRTVVRLFKEPPAEQIADLSMSLLFVLRTIVQLELAIPAEIEAATQLPPSDIDHALRFCLSHGYIEPFQGGYRLTWPWYRTITTVLKRQHLVSL